MWRVAIVALLVAVVVAIVTGEWWASLTIGTVFTVLILFLRAGVIFVSARKVAVIRNRLEFYARLRGPGLGFIIPLWEQVATYLDLGPKPAQFVISDVHTCDRVPVTISLSFFYRLNPWQMRTELRPHLIDRLERSASEILQRHVEHLLHRLVGQCRTDHLLQPRVRASLESRLSDELSHLVGRFGIVIIGQVMLGSISLPEAIQTEINLAQQTRMRARSRADTLDTLRETLVAQPSRAWDKVIEVEAVDAMARSGRPPLFPYSAGWGWETFKDRADGRSQNGKDL